MKSTNTLKLLIDMLATLMICNSGRTHDVAPLSLFAEVGKKTCNPSITLIIDILQLDEAATKLSYLLSQHMQVQSIAQPTSHTRTFFWVASKLSI